MIDIKGISSTVSELATQTTAFDNKLSRVGNSLRRHKIMVYASGNLRLLINDNDSLNASIMSDDGISVFTLTITLKIT